MSNVSDGTYRPSGVITLERQDRTLRPVMDRVRGTLAAYEVFPVDATTRKLLATNDMKGASNRVRRERRLPTLQKRHLPRCVREGLDRGGPARPGREEEAHQPAAEAGQALTEPPERTGSGATDLLLYSC